MFKYDSDKVGRFIGSYLGYWIKTIPSGVLFHVVEGSGKLRLMLEVLEDTTTPQLRDAIPVALEWRDRILSWQGPHTGGGGNQFLMSLDRDHKRGQTYMEIADAINKKVETYLYQHFEFDQEYQTALPTFKTWGDQGDWLHSKDVPERLGRSFALFHARGLLQAIRVKDAEIDGFLKYGLKRISEGESPFEIGYPVSKDKVIATLKSWRGSKKYKLLQKIESEVEAMLNP